MVLSQLADEDLEHLLLIRHFEEALLALFSQGKLNGTTHTCLGQEYIPVALQALLSPHDFVLSNHRGHGHYLARYKDPHGLLAEVMGREGALCHGVGGSQHMYREHYISTGVQGESLSLAVGIGLHLKQQAIPGLALAFIGDGTWGEGSVYEALNLAQLWQVPLMVVVENNGIAQSTPTARAMAGTIRGRAQAFGVHYYTLSTYDINAIREEARALFTTVRATCQPLVLEFETTRLGPHSKGDDTRSPEELRLAASRDWYRVYQAQYPEQFRLLDTRVKSSIEDIVQEVEARPLSTWEELC